MDGSAEVDGALFPFLAGFEDGVVRCPLALVSPLTTSLISGDRYPLACLLEDLKKAMLGRALFLVMGVRGLVESGVVEAWSAGLYRWFS